MSEKLEPWQKRNSEFLKPCFLEKTRKNWSLKFGRTGEDQEFHWPVHFPVNIVSQFLHCRAQIPIKKRQDMYSICTFMPSITFLLGKHLYMRIARYSGQEQHFFFNNQISSPELWKLFIYTVHAAVAVSDLAFRDINDTPFGGRLVRSYSCTTRTPHSRVLAYLPSCILYVRLRTVRRYVGTCMVGWMNRPIQIILQQWGLHHAAILYASPDTSFSP